MLQILFNYVIVIVIWSCIGGTFGAFIGGTFGVCKAMMTATPFDNVVDSCCNGLLTGMKIGVSVPFLFLGLIFKMLVRVINFMGIDYGENFV